MALRLAVVGGSWGGLDALGRLVEALKPSGMAVAAALHRSPTGPEGALVSYLRARTRLPVVEAEDKQAIEPGHVYLAPADYHLLVEPGRFALSIDAPVQYSRPSIDVLFESAADAYGPEVAAVVLTGANDDGCRGVAAVKRRGGLTLVQDPATAVRREMPDAAMGTGLADHVAPVEEIAARLNGLAPPAEPARRGAGAPGGRRSGPATARPSPGPASGAAAPGGGSGRRTPGARR